jgi:hypothetical protein
MTEVLDHRPAAAAGLDPALDEHLAWEPAARQGGVSLLARTTLAAPMVGAAVVHFAMVPSHVDEWTAEGIAFAVVAWLQVALAIALWRRPARTLLAAGIVLNAAVIAAWAWTRTAGSPWGPHADHAEAATFVDIASVVLEGLFVVAALAVLARPQLGTRARGRRAGAAAAVVPVAILALTTAAIASPSARDHAAESHGDHGSAAEGGGHAHDEGAMGAGDHHDGAMPAGHDHPAGDDKGLGMLVNGHHGEMTYVPLDALTQARLDGQLAATREVAATYPTLADAIKGGYTRQGPYSPGLGIHYGRYHNPNTDGVMDREDLLHPMTLIYDGTEPASKLAGFMYYSFAEKQPEGFAGPNDHWHYHTNTCIKPVPDGLDAPFGADRSVTSEQCEAIGGAFLEKTGWMVHVWSVPGYEVPQEEGGVFAEHNAKLACPDGTYYVRPMEEWPDHPLNVCRSA